MIASDPAPLGFVEWFRIGDRRHVDEAITGMKAAGVARLRTQLSWAEWHTPGGAEWYDWLLPRLGRNFDLLPCVHYTPPSLSRTGTSSGAPERLRDYADFIDQMLTRHGRHFEAIELWNEPNNLLDWDWRQDPDHALFCEMIGDAAYWARQRGMPTVLAGPSPFDPVWLDAMGQAGILNLVSAAGIHGFPGTWDSEAAGWDGWTANINVMRGILDRYNPALEIWITEAGYSTWTWDEAEQLRRFLQARAAPAERLYWYGWRDVAADIPVQEGLWSDPRHYSLGAVDAADRPKLLARLLTEGGPARVEALAELASPALRREANRAVAITGGSGFIGVNLADSYLADGDQVLIVDNLSRSGVEENLQWLHDRHGARMHPRIVDIRAPRAVPEALQGARAVFHLAGQTAVTTSLTDPGGDFEVNARGTLNVLEAARAQDPHLPVVFASTNKVYGNLADIRMDLFRNRYLPADPDLREHGIGEDRPLDFCTPYGCSKGVADQYVLDYAKSYGLRTAVLRMSCVYGPRQFGTEDQGWIAHFLLRVLAGEQITIYGDGCQVRDALHVSDAVQAYRAVLGQIDSLSGEAFNLGGGAQNAVSLNAVLHEIGRLAGRTPRIAHDEVRPGDQPWFVADTRKLEQATGWRTTVAWKTGVADLWEWLLSNRFTTEERALA